MKYQPKTIHTLLDQSSTFARLRQHGHQLQQINSIVRSCLPDSTAQHLQACSINGPHLTLYARSAAQATVLRLASSNLLAALHQNHQLTQLSDIRIRITTDRQILPTKPVQPRFLTNSTAKLISDLAETAIDPAIKNILRRLSKRHKNKSIQ